MQRNRRGRQISIAEAGPGDTMHFFGFGNRAPSVAPQWFPGKANPGEAVPVTEADIAAGIDVVMAKGGTVNGQVLDNTDEAPVQGVEICPTPAVARPGETIFCAHSELDGTFVLRNLAAGNYNFEFSTAGHVNYVDQTFTPPALGAGASIGLTAYMRRGVEVTGTMFGAGSGVPVEWLGAPYLPPRVCAVSIETEEEIKCMTLTYGGGTGGAWSIPGIPPNELFTLSFAIDRTVSDGYVGQWWNGVAHFEEATAIFAGPGKVLPGKNAFLIRGEDPLPATELPGEEHSTGTSTDPGTNGIVNFTNPVAPVPWPVTVPWAPPHRVLVFCKKGFRKVTKSGHQRCVKIKRQHRPHKNHHKKAADAHQLPARVP
jgi:hypothetical protein